MSKAKWLEDPEHLSQAMELVPLMDQFIKQVKAVVKEKLIENPEAVPGFKLRKSGEVTAYEAAKVAEILMATNVLTWDDFLKACRYSESPMVKVWADKRGIKASEAKKDLKERLKEVATTRPKSPSIIKSHGK